MAIGTGTTTRFSNSQTRIGFKIVADRTIVQNIRQMRTRVVRNVFLRAEPLAAAMEEDMKRFAPWKDHPERHGEERYPGPMLRDAIYAVAQLRGDAVVIQTGYLPSAIQTVGERAPITYGGILESEEGPNGSDKYWGIVRPIFEENIEAMRALGRGAALVGYKEPSRVPARSTVFRGGAA